MFPSVPPLKHHVQFALKLSVRFTPPAPPKSPSLIYLQIAKSDLPSNHLYDLPPLKLPSPIYLQIAKSNLPSNRLYDLPPPKSPSPIYLQITKSDLPSNHLYDLPPPKLPSPIYPQIANCDLHSNRLYDLPPRNRQVRFTLKSPTAIYPLIVCTIYPPPPSPLKSPSLIYPQIANCNLPSNRLYDLPPPRNRQV